MQTGSDQALCNKSHVFLMNRSKAGIRESAGIQTRFPFHPVQQTGKRPTAALDRNLSSFGLVVLLQAGDSVRLDLNGFVVHALAEESERTARREAWVAPELLHQTPSQEILRATVGQLSVSDCLELAASYQ